VPRNEIGLASSIGTSQPGGTRGARVDCSETDLDVGICDVHDNRRTQTDADADPDPDEEHHSHAHALGIAESFGLSSPVSELLSVVRRSERLAVCIAAARIDISFRIADARGCSRCSPPWERWVLDRVRDPCDTRARTGSVVRSRARSVDRFATREATLNSRNQ